MSWASVAQCKAKSIGQTTISIQYNVLPKSIINEKIDNIPRHKEKTPDPADDFLMINEETAARNKHNHDLDHCPTSKSNKLLNLQIIFGVMEL